MGINITVKLDAADPWITYRAPSAGIGFDVEPEVALAYFTNKGLKPTFAWSDMLGEAHDQSFTVAKMMDLDLLAQVRSEVDAALANGTTLAEFKKTLIPKLQDAGWWGKQDVIDPLTGKVTKAQLGSARRLETIFRTNLQTAYSAGHWANADATKAAMPYLLYDAIDDGRTRVEHALLDGKVLPIDSPFWDTHYPPNGWNCRCGTIQMSEQDLEEYGLEVSKEPKIKYRKWTNPRTGKTERVPVDLDPGWDHNPGKSQSKKLQKLYDEKVANLPPGMRRAVLKSQDALDAAKQKAISDEAQSVIDKIQDEKTKYLYSALQQIKKTKAGKAMSPEDLLQAAQDKAAKAEASAALAHYKQAVVKGKKPSAKAKKAYDALPDEAQKAIDAELLAKSEALQAEKAAAEKLSDIAANPKGQTLKTKALEKLKAEDGWEALSPTEQLGKVEAQAAAAQAKASASAALSGYKKKVLEGKIPTPAQQKAFNGLSQAEKDKFLAKIEAAKPTPGPAKPKPTAGLPEDWDDKKLVQVGKQAGSNEGGTFLDTETGEKYYIKTPKDADIARNEVLAARLYQLAGVDVPELTLIKHNGQVRIASKIVPDVEKLSLPFDPAKYPGIYDDFAADAWLANWDVVGLGYDNLLLKGKKFYRIDVGGSLMYRAQGTAKGAKFGNKVDELNTLRDATTNPQSASVFGQISQEEIAQSAKKIAAISDDDIRRTVELHGPGTAKAKKALADKLIARKADLIKRAGIANPDEKIVQQVIAEQQSLIASQLEEVHFKFVTAIKGIASRAAKGQGVELKDIQRLSEAESALKHLTRPTGSSMTPAGRKSVVAHFQPWIDEMKSAIEGGQGAPINWKAKGTLQKYSGAIDIDRKKITIPEPGQLPKYTDSQAKDILNRALGYNAANINVPYYVGSAHFKAMPIHYQRAMTAWTSSYYSHVTRPVLRGTASSEIHEYVDLLNDALQKSRVKYKGAIGRGLSFDASDKDLADLFWKQHKVGAVVESKVPASWKKGEKGAWGDVHLVLKKSTKGVNTNPISANHGPTEDEVTMPIFKYRVLSIKKKGGRTYILIEEVN